MICHTPSQPIRVCYLIDDLGVGGTESQLLTLIERSDRQRLTPFLCLLRSTNDVASRFPLDACEVTRLEVGSLRSPRTFAKAISFVRYLREKRIDVLHPFFPDSTYFGVPLARVAGVPVVLRTRRNTGYWVTPRHRLLGRVISRLVDATLTNGPSSTAAVIRDERASPRSVIEIPNIVDLDRFAAIPPLAENNTRPDGVRVGVVANLRPVKRLDLLLGAIHELAQRFPEITLQVAGSGDCLAQLQQLASDLAIDRRVHFLGAVDDVPTFLANIDIAVLCSDAEGTSNALLEYMAAGRAIVATDVGDARRLITDGEHGLLVPPADKQALCAALRRLHNSPPYATALGAAARRRAFAQFSPQSVLRTYETTYAALLNGVYPP